MLTAEQFLGSIEAFLVKNEMSASAFGRAAIGDPNFVGDLRAGRMPNLRIVRRVDDFIAKKSPENVPAEQPAEAAE